MKLFEVLRVVQVVKSEDNMLMNCVSEAMVQITFEFLAVFGFSHYIDIFIALHTIPLDVK
jgi:hypothetical protein